VVAQPEPMVARGKRHLSETRRFEILLLPLSDSGTGVDQILGALLYADPMTPDM
jgi:hypothetical protein